MLLIQTMLFRYHIMHSKVFCEESSSIDEERNLSCMVLQLSVRSVEMPSRQYLWPLQHQLHWCILPVEGYLFAVLKLLNFCLTLLLPLVDSKCPCSIWWKSVIMFMTWMNLSCNLYVRDRVPKPPGKSLNIFHLNSWPWNVLDNWFGSWKSWKFDFEVLNKKTILCGKMVSFVVFTLFTTEVCCHLQLFEVFCY